MKNLGMFGMVVALMFALGLSACAQDTGKTSEPAEGTTGAIAWMDYDAGIAKAKEAGKPVMVDFYTTWCKYCKMLDESTYKDPEIISILNSSFVSIKVDAEGSGSATRDGKKMSLPELAKSYNVQGYPTIWLIDEKGAPIGPLPGYSPPEDFKPVLTYITSGAYARGVKYSDYIESLKGAGAEQPAATQGTQG